MRENLRYRNLGVNSYLGILGVTVVGGLATLFIVHVAIDVPFKTLVLPEAYAIDSSL